MKIIFIIYFFVIFLVLKFLDPLDIVDGKLKTMLALLWKLILNYSIERPSFRWAARKLVDHFSPREALLAWVNSKLAALNVNNPDVTSSKPKPLVAVNFTSNFYDGRLLGALVHSLILGMLIENF